MDTIDRQSTSLLSSHPISSSDNPFSLVEETFEAWVDSHYQYVRLTQNDSWNGIAGVRGSVGSSIDQV